MTFEACASRNSKQSTIWTLPARRQAQCSHMSASQPYCSLASSTRRLSLRGTLVGITRRRRHLSSARGSLRYHCSPRPLYTATTCRLPPLCRRTSTLASQCSGSCHCRRSRVSWWCTCRSCGSSVERLLLQQIDSSASTSTTPRQTAGGTAEDPARRTTPEMLDLPNGCLCCSIKSGGLRAIEQLIRTRGPFDHILRETSGCL